MIHFTSGDIEAKDVKKEDYKVIHVIHTTYMNAMIYSHSFSSLPTTIRLT